VATAERYVGWYLEFFGAVPELIDPPWKIMSVARRDWAIVGHSL
jgi:hypothetical protein